MTTTQRYRQGSLFSRPRKQAAHFDPKAKRRFEGRRSIPEKKFNLLIGGIRAGKPIMLKYGSVPEIEMRRISDRVNLIAREVALGALPKEALIEKLEGALVESRKPAGLKQPDGSIACEVQLWEFKYKENQPIEGKGKTYTEVKVYPVEGSKGVVKLLPNGREIMIMRSARSKKERAAKKRAKEAQAANPPVGSKKVQESKFHD